MTYPSFPAMFSIRSFALTLVVLTAAVLAQAVYMNRAIDLEENVPLPGMSCPLSLSTLLLMNWPAQSI